MDAPEGGRLNICPKIDGELIGVRSEEGRGKQKASRVTEKDDLPSFKNTRFLFLWEGFVPVRGADS